LVDESGPRGRAMVGGFLSARAGYKRSQAELRIGVEPLRLTFFLVKFLMTLE
jgi:hypothetical protein